MERRPLHTNSPYFEMQSSDPEDVYAYKKLSLILESELALHDGRSGAERHTGVTDNIEHIIQTIRVHGYALNGIHESCKSGIYSLPSRPDEKVVIACIMFRRNQADSRYHVGYIGKDAHDIDTVKDRITEVYAELYATDMHWTERKGSAYYIQNSRYLI